MTFLLHEKLAADTVPIGVLPLCQVLLMNDANYPWCVLVPQRAGIREIHELAADDRRQLVEEIAAVAAAMASALAAQKMNVAALGNVVPQLHVHVIARYENDLAWPAPIWGRVPARLYESNEIAMRLTELRNAFNPIPGFRTR